VSFSVDVLRAELRRLTQQPLANERPPERFLVALSGGLDSCALLHALVAVEPRPEVAAVHVDHALHPESGDWAAFCQRVCDDASGDEDWWQRLAAEFHAFSVELMHHESKENELLLSTYDDDIGSKD